LVCSGSSGQAPGFPPIPPIGPNGRPVLIPPPWYQNQPNPFTDKTSIGFYLPEAGSATLSILDDSGRLLFSQTAAYAKGYNAVTINRSLLPANGLLFYRLATATDQATRTMMVMGP
jgi:hypothetical protein